MNKIGFVVWKSVPLSRHFLFEVVTVSARFKIKVVWNSKGLSYLVDATFNKVISIDE